MLCPQHGSAATILWSGTAGDGQWTTPANWIGEQLPTSIDLPYFSSSKFVGDQMIDIDGLIEVARIGIAGEHIAGTAGGNITLQGGGSLSINNSYGIRHMMLGARMVFDIPVTIPASYTGNVGIHSTAGGDLVFNEPVFAGSENQWLIYGSGTNGGKVYFNADTTATGMKTLYGHAYIVTNSLHALGSGSVIMGPSSTPFTGTIGLLHDLTIDDSFQGEAFKPMIVQVEAGDQDRTLTVEGGFFGEKLLMASNASGDAGELHLIIRSGMMGPVEMTSARQTITFDLAYRGELYTRVPTDLSEYRYRRANISGPGTVYKTGAGDLWVSSDLTGLTGGIVVEEGGLLVVNYLNCQPGGDNAIYVGSLPTTGTITMAHGTKIGTEIDWHWIKEGNFGATVGDLKALGDLNIVVDYDTRVELAGDFVLGGEGTTGTATLSSDRFGRGTLSLTSTASYNVDLNGADDCDRLVLDWGAFIVDDAALALSLNYAPTVGDVLTLVSMGDANRTGYFAGLGEGQAIDLMFDGVTYRANISYEGGAGEDITLTFVPEPVTLASLLLGGIGMLTRRQQTKTRMC